MQSVENDGKKKKKKKEIIRKDSVLVGEKGVDSFKKKRCDRQRLKCMSVDKIDFCVEGGWFDGATGAMV